MKDINLYKDRLIKIKKDFESIDINVLIECNIKYITNETKYNNSKRMIDNLFIEKIKKENNIPDNNKIIISLDDAIKIFNLD